MLDGRVPYPSGRLEGLLIVAVYLLSAVGMAGVWLVPAHLWSLLVSRRIRHPLPRAPRGILIGLLAGIPLAVSIVIGAFTIPRVFRCLSDPLMRCGPNRAGGLLALAAFGFSVLLAEVVWQIAAVLCGRSAGAAG